MGTKDGVSTFAAELPFDQVFIGESTRSAPAGMKVLDENRREVSFGRNSSPKDQTDPSWRLDGNIITLRIPEGRTPPPNLRVKYPAGARWMNQLDPALTAASEQEFALRRTGLVHDDREGLLLPAPSTSTWRVVIPAGAELHLDAKILPPAVLDGHESDGAVVEALVLDSGSETLLDSLELEPGEGWQGWSVDLDRYSGREIELVLRSSPGDRNELDYVFLAEPIIHVPRAEPRRLVLIFVDTLRRDHVGFYGYQKHATTPELDAWAEDAVVFDNAHAFSPWTLPSVQALLSGREPHSWSSTDTLQQALRDGGFTTAFLCANPYLKPAFGMSDGWSQYRFKFMADAEHQVDAAIAILEEHKKRDLALMVQFMDPHLPYREPMPFRGLWAGERPPALPGLVTRDRLVEIEPEDGALAKIKPWVIARYDQNIRYVDDQIGRLLRHLDDDDVVVFFSDHGEEFWEHGGVEHGHTVYEELLAVPLAIKAPGMNPGRVDAPVSLIDVAPTVAELLAIEPPSARGTSLVASTAQSPELLEALSQRPLAFGQTLYGDEAWGFYDGATKRFVWGAEQHEYDLSTDSNEESNLATDRSMAEPDIAALEQALGCPVFPVWRVAGEGLRKSTKQKRGSVTLSHPDGFTATWSTAGIRAETAEPAIVEGRVVVQAGGGERIPREFYAIGPPTGPCPSEMSLVVDTGKKTLRSSAGDAGDDEARGSSCDSRSVEVGKGAYRYTLTTSIAPRCEVSTQTEVDDQTLEQLRELGYIE